MRICQVIGATSAPAALTPVFNATRPASMNSPPVSPRKLCSTEPITAISASCRPMNDAVLPIDNAIPPGAVMRMARIQACQTMPVRPQMIAIDEEHRRLRIEAWQSRKCEQCPGNYVQEKNCDLKHRHFAERPRIFPFNHPIWCRSREPWSEPEFALIRKFRNQAITVRDRDKCASERWAAAEVSELDPVPRPCS